MIRSGIVIVLGAGASADVGYPLASGLLERFRRAVEEASIRDVEIRNKALDSLSKFGIQIDRSL